MFAPAGRITARAGLRSKLAALVVRRQALAPQNPTAGVDDAKSEQSQECCVLLHAFGSFSLLTPPGPKHPRTVGANIVRPWSFALSLTLRAHTVRPYNPI